MNHNFIISNADTDSISFIKPDQGEFSAEERKTLLQELNNKCPQGLVWEDDGYFSKVIIFRAKNYVLLSEDGKVKKRGSAVKSPAKEPAIRDFVNETIQAILDDKSNFTEIYHKIVREITSPKIDINRFATRKTLTQKTYESERANESKIIDAIKDTEYVEGNRIWVYFTQEGTLKLAEHYNGDHDPQVLLKKLYMTSKLFDTVLPTKELYLNYSLKRNQKLLESLKYSNCRDPEFAQVMDSFIQIRLEIARENDKLLESLGNPAARPVINLVQHNDVINLPQELESPPKPKKTTEKSPLNQVRQGKINGFLQNK